MDGEEAEQPGLKHEWQLDYSFRQCCGAQKFMEISLKVLCSARSNSSVPAG
jgi:hypothetical protein